MHDNASRVFTRCECQFTSQRIDRRASTIGKQGSIANACDEILFNVLRFEWSRIVGGDPVDCLRIVIQRGAVETSV